MKTLKKLSIVAAALVLSAATASASTVPTSYSGTITDNYIGKGYQGLPNNIYNDGDSIGSPSVYGVMKLDYVKTGDKLVVRIYTNFTTANINPYSYGDLFLSSDTSDKGMSRDTSKLDANANWEYAFNMTNNASEGTSGTGTLDDYATSRKIYGSTRHDYVDPYDTKQVVRVEDGTSFGAGTWTKGAGFIEYTFSLAGTTLVNADALAFRWAMTCGNDIIQGHTDGGPGNGGPDVAEPATLGLLGLGLVGFGLVRRRRVA